MSSVGGSSGSSRDTIENLYDQYGDGSSEDREVQAEGSEPPRAPAGDDASNVLAAHAEASQVPQLLVTGDSSSGPDSHQRSESQEMRHQIQSNIDPRSLTAGRALRPSRSATALLQRQSGTDTHQRSESEEFRHEIESNVDPRTLIAGRELRPSRSMTSLAGSIDSQALKAAEVLPGAREMRLKAKAQLDREAAERKAMGVIEKTPEQIAAERQQNANLIATSSQSGPSGPFRGLRRAIQLREAFNKDVGKNLPGTAAVFEVTGRLTARKVKQGAAIVKDGAIELGSATQNYAGKVTRRLAKTLNKAKGGPEGPGGPEDPKDPEGPDPKGPKDEDGYDADDPKGKRKAREEEE